MKAYCANIGWKGSAGSRVPGIDPHEWYCWDRYYRAKEWKLLGDHYILDEDGNLKVVGVMEWAEYFEKADRTIAKTDLPDCNVSTVFLGLDHNFGMMTQRRLRFTRNIDSDWEISSENKDDISDVPEMRPLLFETMVFGGDICDEWTWRYATKREAEEGHRYIVGCLEVGEEPL